LTLKLAKNLLQLLNGKFEVLSKGDKPDYGFIFHLGFSIVPETKKDSISLTDKEEKQFIIPKEIQDVKKNITMDEPKPKSIEGGFEEVPSSRIILNKFTFDEEEIDKPEPLGFDEELINLENEIREIKPFKKLEKLDLSLMSCLYLEDQIDSQILFKVQMKSLSKLNLRSVSRKLCIIRQ